MATIKSFTDLQQSKKLVEILPIESADMYYEKGIGDNYRIAFGNYADMSISENLLHIDVIPCWSLAALIGVLPMIRKGEDTANPFIAKTPDDEYYIVYATLTKEIDGSAIYNNPIDACCEVIIRFNKLKML